MGHQTPKVIILVLNWNGWRDTLECLESLYANDYPDYQVVFLDNCSEDDSLERIRQWADGNTAANPFVQCPLPYIEYDRQAAEQGGLAAEEARLYVRLPARIPHPLIIIRTGQNLGFAGGNNVGLRYARQRGAEYVLLLNNDAWLRSCHAITTMVGFMTAHPQVGACGGRLFYPDGSAQISYGNFPSLTRALAFLFPVYKLLPRGMFRNIKRANVVPDESIREPLPVDYPSGACLLVRNETINDVGLLDERFFMYAEETDWCLRMQKRGWQRFYIPQAEIVHKFAGSFNRSAVRMNRYFLDSLFKYYRKNFTPWRLSLLVAGYLLRSLYSMLHWAIAARLMPEAWQQPAQEQACYWRKALELSVTVMKDLLAGEIGRKKGRNHARQTR